MLCKKALHTAGTGINLYTSTTQEGIKMNEQQKGLFLNNWDTLEDMKKSFWPSWYENPLTDELDRVNILLASYGTPDYEGYAFVLFERDGALYEVNASHCSCFGLEGQWEPEETSVEAVMYLLEKGTLGKGGYDENPFAEELRNILIAYGHKH